MVRALQRDRGPCGQSTASGSVFSGPTRHRQLLLARVASALTAQQHRGAGFRPCSSGGKDARSEVTQGTSPFQTLT